MIIPSKLGVREHAIERSEGLCEFFVWIRFWTLSPFVSGLRKGFGVMYGSSHEAFRD